MSGVNALAAMDAAIDNLQSAGYIGNTIGLRKSREAVAKLFDAVRPAITEEGMSQDELNRLRLAFAHAGGAA